MRKPTDDFVAPVTFIGYVQTGREKKEWDKTCSKGQLNLGSQSRGLTVSVLVYCSAVKPYEPN